MPVVFHADDFLHPLDLAARQQLEAIPFLQKAVQKYLSLVTDRQSHQMLLSSALRLGPRQLPDYYRLLPPICEAFGIPEPDLFLMPGEANAVTIGHSHTAIVIYGELLESLDQEEVQAVLAHECGHILAEHLLYRQMATVLLNLGGQAGWFGSPVSKLAEAAAVPLRLALLNWYRKSELTADRAATAFMGSPEPMQRALFHMLGVPKWWPGVISYAEFAAQAEEFDANAESSTMDRFITGRLERGSTHPIPPIRIRELMTWSTSPTYLALRGIADSHHLDQRQGCLTCGHQLEPGWKFCQHCGAPAGRAAIGLEGEPR